MRYEIHIDEERCKGCALCVDACMRASIRMCNRLNSQGYSVAEMCTSNGCTGCKQCADVCPDAAITIEAHEDQDSEQAKNSQA